MGRPVRFAVHAQIDPEFKSRVTARLLRAAARAALEHQAAPAPAALTVRVTGDDALRRLNQRFLRHDYATDVLSFPSDESDDEVPYLGDVVISLPRAAAQARAGRHPLDAEMQLLVVHGVLHLLGHDHARKRDQVRMWAAQAEILTALGVPITEPAPESLKTGPTRRMTRR